MIPGILCQQGSEFSNNDSTYSASIFVAASGTAVLSILIFAFANHVTRDLNGAIVGLLGGGLVLKDAQPCGTICGKNSLNFHTVDVGVEVTDLSCLHRN